MRKSYNLRQSRKKGSSFAYGLYDDDDEEFLPKIKNSSAGGQRKKSCAKKELETTTKTLETHNEILTRPAVEIAEVEPENFLTDSEALNHALDCIFTEEKCNIKKCYTAKEFLFKGMIHANRCEVANTDPEHNQKFLFCKSMKAILLHTSSCKNEDCSTHLFVLKLCQFHQETCKTADCKSELCMNQPRNRQEIDEIEEDPPKQQPLQPASSFDEAQQQYYPSSLTSIPPAYPANDWSHLYQIPPPPPFNTTYQWQPFTNPLPSNFNWLAKPNEKPLYDEDTTTSQVKDKTSLLLEAPSEVFKDNHLQTTTDESLFRPVADDQYFRPQPEVDVICGQSQWANINFMSREIPHHADTETADESDSDGVKEDVVYDERPRITPVTPIENYNHFNAAC